MYRTKSVINSVAHGGAKCTTDRHTRTCNLQACPIDCKVTAWTGYDACTKTCGTTGLKTKTRTVVTKAKYGGIACPTFSNTVSCNRFECPIDCKVSAWSGYGACAASCNSPHAHGTPLKFKTRTITTDSKHGGVKCPTLRASAVCNDFACPIDCKLSTWSGFTTCTKSCGTGTMSRSKSVVTKVAHGGAACTSDRHTRTCNVQACPIDCKISGWSGSSTCTEKCGGGITSKTRSVINAAAHGGVECATRTQKDNCNTHPCPVDCVHSWNSWSTCSLTCGTGVQTRTYDVDTAAVHGGDECPTEMDRVCNTQKCPIDCVVSKWNSYAACSATCGTGGIKVKTRTVTTDQKYGGKLCPTLSHSMTCSRFACPIDCKYSAWSAFSQCTKSCRTGTQFRSRSVINQKAHGGSDCADVDFQYKSCNTYNCPVDCKVSHWSGASTCTEKCGGGVTSKTRSVVTKASNGGNACPLMYARDTCNTHPCAIDCEHRWGTWSSCSKTCGTGIRLMTFTVTRATAHGGDECPTEKDEVCNTFACPIDCKVSSWGRLSTCTEKCGGGVNSKTRSVINAAAHGGAGCPTMHARDNCNTHPCPRDCTHSWNSWSSCTKSCGTGVQTRTYDVRTAAAHGGDECPTEMDRVCNLNSCPRDCIVSAWSAWTTCSKTCGTRGTTTRTRRVTTDQQFGGKLCPTLSAITSCNRFECPIDCKLSTWSTYSSCTKSCGTGTMYRTKSVINSAAHGGADCTTDRHTRTCNLQACPIDCKVSGWSGRSACTERCGGGVNSKTRSVINTQKYGGRSCPSLKTAVTCNSHPCPIDCAHSWNSWTSCSKSCGTGVQSRTFDVDTDAAHGGEECPTEMDRTCNVQHCPIDGKVTSWSNYGPCSKTCGTGIKIKTRKITTDVKFGGQAPPALSFSAVCNTFRCPVDCKVSTYTAYSSCTKTCGTAGTRTRSRSVLTPAAHGGVKCAGAVDTVGCNRFGCPVDCKLSNWGAFSTCTNSCGTGTKFRSKSVITKVAHGGASCGADRHTTTCALKECCVKCFVSGWTAGYTACSEKCGGGVKSRTRSIIQNWAYCPEKADFRCPTLTAPASCNTHPCPIDCTHTWNAWSPCTKTCGTGVQTRTFDVDTATAHGGDECPTEMDRVCNSNSCPVDCVVSRWDRFQACTKTCGTSGTKTKIRSVTTQAAFGGKICPTVASTTSCNRFTCPVDCKLSAFTVWSACTKTCGTGTSYRKRSLITSNAHGGKKCDETHQYKTCAIKACPIDCKMSGWNDHNVCKTTCTDEGSKKERHTKYRSVITAAQHGGLACGASSHVKDCREGADWCPIDCVMSAWNKWSGCSKSCGVGTEYRHRKYLIKSKYGGKECPATHTSEYQTCSIMTCSVDCTVSGWTAFDTCSATCGYGAGTKTKRRSVITQTFRTGKACPALTATKECNQFACPIDCEMSNWSSHEGCTEKCGGGVNFKYKSIVTAVAHGGKNCPTSRFLSPHKIDGWKFTKKYQRSGDDCNTHPCPIDCVHEFEPWTKCTASCGKGMKWRYVVILTEPMHGGDECPYSQKETCNTHACPTPFPTSFPTASPTSYPTIPTTVPCISDHGVKKTADKDCCVVTATESCSGITQHKYQADQGMDGKKCKVDTMSPDKHAAYQKVTCNDAVWTNLKTLKTHSTAAGRKSNWATRTDGLIELTQSGSYYQKDKIGFYNSKYTCSNKNPWTGKRADERAKSDQHSAEYTIQFEVEDKVAPVITCPADIEIEASFPFTQVAPTCYDCFDGTRKATLVSNNVDVEKATTGASFEYSNAKHTTTTIDSCKANSVDDQIEYVKLDSHTATTLTGTVGYKPLHSGSWTMSSGVSVQCWHYTAGDKTWDSSPILSKQDSGIGYSYGYGKGPSRTHSFTFTPARLDQKTHYVRCGIIDRASSTCKFDTGNHCASNTAGSSTAHHYDNADVQFTVGSSKSGYEVKWSCSDKMENTATCSQKVTVKDTLKPVIALKLGSTTIHVGGAADTGLKAGGHGHISKSNFANPAGIKFMEQVAGVNAWALAGVAAAVAGVAILAFGGRKSELEVLI